MTTDARTIDGLVRREAQAGSRLPYSHHVDDATLATRDGMVMQILHIDGLPFETADTDELNYRHGLRQTMLRTIADPQIALYHHILRRPVQVSAPDDARFPDGFSRDLNAAWHRRLGAKRLYVNSLFLAVVHRPLAGRTGWLEAALSVFRRSEGEQRQALAQGTRALESAVQVLLSALEPYGARRLGVYQSPQGPCSEPLEFLSFLYNAELRPVLLPHADLGQYLPYKRVSFGGNTIDLAGATPSDRRFSAIISIKDYPQATTPGLLDALLRLPHELVVSQSYACVDRQVALNRMNLALRRMRAAEDDALSLRSQLAAAKDDVASGRSSFGEHHLTVQVRVPKLDDLDDAVADVLAGFADLGLIAVREDIALEPAFWAQFPGNFKDVGRRALVSSANFASLASLHSFPIGQPDANHWGDAITTLETTSGTPYAFNFHKGDLGNFTVIGPSGSGKTVVLNFLLAQARKLNPRILFFDKDRGAEIFIRAIGGNYSVIRPGYPTGFNPLLLADTPGNRRFLNDWIGQLVTNPGERLDPTERELIDQAVDANFTQSLPFRQLRYFRELLSGRKRPMPGDLAHRLGQWVEGGERAWLFDQPDDQLDLAQPSLGFDMTQILDDPVSRTPVMMYLFHRIEERLDGTPTLVVVDEGWKALDDEVFVARIKDWEKTIRKRNGIVGFCTQNASDALASRIGPAIIEQAATQIFMPNPKAQAEDYRNGFGLSAHEFDLVRSLPDTSRCFLIKHGADSVIARLDLSGLDRLLTVLSGRESTVRRLDTLRAELGDAPEAWLAPLLERAS
jgi:type IV secretion system protein VirB4